MKSAEDVLSDWVLNRVHFNAGKGLRVWTVADFLGLLRFLNGEFLGQGGSFWTSKAPVGKADWGKADRMRSILQVRGRQVTAMELLKAGSLREYLRDLIVEEHQNLEGRQPPQGSQGDLKTHKDHIGSLPPQKRAANRKIRGNRFSIPQGKT